MTALCLANTREYYPGETGFSPMNFCTIEVGHGQRRHLALFRPCHILRQETMTEKSIDGGEFEDRSHLHCFSTS